MKPAHTPRRITQSVSVQHIGEETLVYDGARHLAFCLNSICATVWKLADGSRTPREIAEAAHTQLNRELTEDLIALTLQTLQADGLLEPEGKDTANSGPFQSISRRAILQRLGAGGAMLLPLITSIVAPTAAQAYNGCVDCTTSNSRAAKIRKLQQSSGEN